MRDRMGWAALSRFVPFLRSHPPLEQEHAERILLVGSGSRQNIERALASIAARFPAARLTLVARPDERRYSHMQLERVIAYRGLTSAAGVRREAGVLPYDVTVVLFTGEGEPMLKVLAFLLTARRMLAFTEGGGVFTWSFDERLAIWNHARWRFGGGRPLIATLQRLLRSVLTAMLSFAGFLLLLLWFCRLLLSRLLPVRIRKP